MMVIICHSTIVYSVGYRDGGINQSYHHDPQQWYLQVSLPVRKSHHKSDHMILCQPEWLPHELTEQAEATISTTSRYKRDF